MKDILKLCKEELKTRLRNRKKNKKINIDYNVLKLLEIALKEVQRKEEIEISKNNNIHPAYMINDFEIRTAEFSVRGYEPTSIEDAKSKIQEMENAIFSLDTYIASEEETDIETDIEPVETDIELVDPEMEVENELELKLYKSEEE